MDQRIVSTIHIAGLVKKILVLSIHIAATATNDIDLPICICRMTAQNIKEPWPKKGTPLWFRAKKGHTGNEILGREKIPRNFLQFIFRMLKCFWPKKGTIQWQ